MFCRTDGRPSRRQGVYAGFQRACNGTWHPHELRHSFVSLLSDHGVDMEQVSDAVGHTNSTITRNVYRYQIADKVAQAQAMDQIFGTGSAS